MRVEELELDVEPESAYIKGPKTVRVPETIYEHGELVGYQWKQIRVVELLKNIPLYNPFTSAEGYEFDSEHWDKIISFIVNECCFPEGHLTGKPFIPELWQSAIYANLFCWKKKGTDIRRYKECFIYVPRKNGKELAVDTPIPTPNGFTPIGDLKVGDTVFDKDGKQCKVTFVADRRVPERTYKVTFSSGCEVLAGADHQWHVFSRKTHPRKDGEFEQVGSKDLYEGVWTTDDMLSVGVDSSYGKTFFVEMHSGIECDEKELPIEPYLLGAWLGDGTSSGPYLTVGKQDIHEWTGRKAVKDRNGNFTVHLDELKGRLLSKLNLKHNKHIPEGYFTASKSQRLALLQGLMDTDGTISKRGTDLMITQKSNELALQIYRLCYSLGLKASISERICSSQNGTKGTYYTVQFAAGKEEHEVFRYSRKLNRMKQTRKRGKSNHIVSIEPCDPTEMLCITVDSPSGTYLFGEQYLPTHNTVAFGSIISLLMFFCDSEKRGQLYAAAADVEQASLNFRHTTYMIENNPKLIGRLREKKIYRSSRSFEHTDGTIFKVLSSVADTKHGLSPSFVYIDEVHAHPNSDLIDVLLTGTGARRQPLVVYTTTADFDRPSVCNKLRDKAYAIATDKQWEPEFLPVLYESQIDEDFSKEPVWKKSNPCYGRAINSDYFERLVRDAKNNPVELNRFLRLHLNIRTKTETAWIPPHIWAYGNPDPESPLMSVAAIKEWMSYHPAWFNIVSDQKFSTATSVDVYIGRYQAYWSWFIRQCETLTEEECYAGFDNASVKDIASLNLWFPRVGVMLHFGWCPAVSIYQRSQEQNLPYNIWWEAGVLNATSPLDTVDENAILSAMLGDEHTTGIFNHFRGCREVCFDRWGSHHVYTTLKQYGFPARAYPQSFAGMNEPCRRLEALCMDKQFFHGGHPVLEWMVGNVVIVQSRDGQMRPDRSKSTNKIDGIVAGLMAMGSWLYPEIETITEIRGLKNA